MLLSFSTILLTTKFFTRKKAQGRFERGHQEDRHEDGETVVHTLRVHRPHRVRAVPESCQAKQRSVI